MGIIVNKEIGRYDPYTDKFIKNTTTDRIEIGTDGNLYRLSVSKDRLYTKADVMAMLEDIKLGIKEYCDDQYAENEYPAGYAVIDIVQQKINALRENMG